MTWIKLGDHLVNSNNIGGFSLISDYKEEKYQVSIHYLSSTYGAFYGTKEECERIMKILRQTIDCVWMVK